MGLLDEYLLRGKPKVMPLEASKGFDPTAPMGMTAGDELDPFGSARRAEALEVRGAAEPNVPGGMLAGPNQQRAFAHGDKPYGPRPGSIADAAPPRTMAGMDFGLGDNFPGVKNQERLAEGLQMKPIEAAPPPVTMAAAAAPSPAPAPAPAFPPPRPSGLLSPKAPPPPQFAQTAPLPPPRGMLAGPPPSARAELPPRPMAASSPMPPPRPPGIGNMTAEAAPMPPPRPPELGGLGAQADAAIVPPAPVADTPIIGMGGGGNAEGASLMAGGAPIADAGSAIGGAAGGMAGLDGILGGIGGLVKAFGGGGKGGGAPPAKAPQFSPSNAGPTVDAEIAKDRQQAPQIMAGLLADDVKSLIDPRKQRLA